MKFDASEDTLFTELVLQTIMTLGPCGNSSKLADPARFCAGDYVGGQSDMRVDQETHLLLEYAEVIDKELLLRFDAAELRSHLHGAERFGVDLTWLLERFLATVFDWHPLGYKHPIFSYDPIKVPSEFRDLFAAFSEASYVSSSGCLVRWTERVTPTMGLLYWGWETDRGEDVRNEAAVILNALPAAWRDRIPEDMSRNFQDQLADALSNHWYNGAWHDTPVRGSRPPVYMREAMYDRAGLLWQAVYGKLRPAT